MFSVFICEDDDRYLHMINQCVSEHILIEGYKIDVAVCTKDPAEIIEFVSRSKGTGLYFLDVELGGGCNGVDVARQIREYDPRGYIVFITAHPNYMELTFEYKVEPLDYICKTDEDDVRQKVCDCIKHVHNLYLSHQNKNYFTFKVVGEHNITCFHDQILFFEAGLKGDKQIVLHTEKKQYTFYGVLKNVANSLPKNLFFMCHRSFVVNISKIPESGILKLKLGKNFVTMPNGYNCQVSFRKRRQLLKMVEVLFES